jgi:hypothetical protein
MQRTAARRRRRDVREYTCLIMVSLPCSPHAFTVLSSMSLENVFLASTNVAALVAVRAALQKRPVPWVLLFLVVGAGASSLIYHLLEHAGPHNMPGYFAHARGMDIAALWVDRAFAVPLIVAVASRCAHVPRERVYMFALLLLELTSEFVTLRRESYVVVHGLWHVAAFVHAAHVINTYY